MSSLTNNTVSYVALPHLATPASGAVSFRESPERESRDEHCNQHQESNQHTNNGEKRIVEEEDASFQSVYDPYRLLEWDGGLCIIDHQHISITGNNLLPHCGHTQWEQ